MKRKIKYPAAASESAALKDALALPVTDENVMLRTQIYLSRAEHEFVRREAARRDRPMAAVIREFIDEKMRIPDDAWTNNPMLEPTVHDPDWKGPEDGGINHDHYLYGCPKKWIKVKGEYVEAPPLPADYYENHDSADAYDRKIRELDETR